MQDAVAETGESSGETTASSPVAPASRRGWRAVFGVIIITFAMVAPTLTWLEFSGGAENINVATAMEIRREHRWLLPTLQGEARIAKPPLNAWITAAAISDSTQAAMSSRDAVARDRAEKSLAWQVRWTPLLSSCLMLLAAAELARVLSGGDMRMAGIAAAACASNLFFLRHGRMATTDVQLALWVAATNVCLAHAIIRGRGWIGAIGGGFFLGLAFMSKGPVAIVQTVVPVLVFVLVCACIRRRTSLTGWMRVMVQVCAGAIVFALIALPWYVLVMMKTPHVWSRWQIEVTREGATDLPPGHWWGYISLFAYIMPWTVFLIAGIAVIVRDAAGKSNLVLGGSDTPVRHRAQPDTSSRDPMLLALLMLIVPIVVMSFFRDRKERYLLPMIVPASIVIARAVVEHVRTRHLRRAADRVVVALHWGTLLVIAIGLPVAGAATLKGIDGGRWFSPMLAAIAGVIGVAIVIGGMIHHRKCPGRAIAAATLLLMVAMQALFIHGYRASREGVSPMKPLATLVWNRAPDAQLFTTGTKQQRAPTDLAIYLNRAVLWVDDAKDIPATARPAVIIIRQRKGESPPSPPSGSIIGKVARDEAWWWAFELH